MASSTKYRKLQQGRLDSFLSKKRRRYLFYYTYQFVFI